MPARAENAVTGETLSEAERRRFIDELRENAEREYGPSARRAVGTQLSAGHPCPWAYVYELVQNAIDAKARRCLWRSTADGVEFHHDGSVLLNKPHVRGMASLGDSTKGLDTIGFMGIGFKSVFAQYRRIRITGNGWRFGFEIGFDHGDVGQKIPRWFDALLPHWDDAAGAPVDEYTTAIRLDRRRQTNLSPLADIERLAPDDNPARLAILGLRGLEQLRIDDVTWEMRSCDGIVDVRRSADNVRWRWKPFVEIYSPDDEAMRRFLEARQELRDQRGQDGHRVARSVVALLPLDNDGMPDPPKHGTTYATLPTDTGLPLGFHLQADWLVNADRGVLREVAGNSWQETIMRQVPKIVLAILAWYANTPVYAKPRSYDVLCDPTTGDGPLARCISELRDEFDRCLSGSEIAPIHGAGETLFLSPECITRLPSGFRRDFRDRPDWRPDLLFGQPVLNEGALGERGTAFARWLEWGREIDVTDVPWSQTLPTWWSALPSKDRVDALFALWNAIAGRDWGDAPVVPTESGKWIAVRDALWLTEEPPSVNEPYGGVVADALREHLPHADRRLPPDIRHAVNRNRDSAGGPKWFLKCAEQRKLPRAIQCACSGIQNNADFPLVELARWAAHRGERRRDLVPMVATEQGPRDPDKALMADPLTEGGENRRRLFADTPSIIGEYVAEGDVGAIVRLLELAGARGGGDLLEDRRHVGRYHRNEVAQGLDVPVDCVEQANDEGYHIIDYRFPFDTDTTICDVLQDWLSREYTKFLGKGKLCAYSSYYGHRRTLGRARASWVVTLQDNPWVLCRDGDRRKPADVVLPPGANFEDAPIADIDSGLAKALETEGIRFGSNVSKSPVLRRLSIRGSHGIPGNDLAELLREAREEVESGRVTKEDIRAVLGSVVLQHEEGKFPLHRIVQRAGGTGVRGTLGGWVVPLSNLDGDLVSAIEPVWRIPDMITGRQALGFLLDVWGRRPNQVERIRGPVATAFRYVFDDIDSRKLPRVEWDHACERAHLFGGDAWHALGPGLVVEDTRSPLIRKLLSSDRVAVSASHLGETPDEIRRTAGNLDLALLSDEIKVEPGRSLDAPDGRDKFQILIDMLALLPDRQSLRKVVVVEHLRLRVSGRRHSVNAYIEGESMYLVGGFGSSAVDAAAQLVEYFRLGQQGESIPYLTDALSAIDDERRFLRNLEVLAEGLGVSIPGGATEQGALAGGGTETGNARGLSSGVRQGGSIGGSTGGTERKIGAIGGRTSSGTSGGVSHPAGRRTRRTGADRFKAVLVEQGAISNPSHVTEERRKECEDRGDDNKSRMIVLEYERNHGREAKAMAPDHPGYDIESTEPEAGVVRRIEVKGMQGAYREDASVLLSDRQGRDALRNESSKIQYWLYVVDCMDTEAPNVHPVSWTGSQLRFGFYASVWANADK